MEIKLTFHNNQIPTTKLPYTVPSNVNYNVTYVNPTLTQPNYNVPINNMVNNRTIIPNPRLVPNMFIPPRQQTIPTVSIGQMSSQPVRRTCCGGAVVH